jgi:hypothetical protein
MGGSRRRSRWVGPSPESEGGRLIFA